MNRDYLWVCLALAAAFGGALLNERYDPKYTRLVSAAGTWKVQKDRGILQYDEVRAGEVMVGVDEIERIESRRWVIFVCEAALGFLVAIWLTKDLLASVVLSIGLGLFFSGYQMAKQLTQDVSWAYLEAEGRLTGFEPSKRGVWVGGLLPGALVALLGAWLVLKGL